MEKYITNEQAGIIGRSIGESQAGIIGRSIGESIVENFLRSIKEYSPVNTPGESFRQLLERCAEKIGQNIKMGEK